MIYFSAALSLHCVLILFKGFPAHWVDPVIYTALHPYCAASVMSCIRPVLHPSCPASVLPCIWSVLHPSCSGTVLSYILPVLRPSRTAFVLACIHPVLRPSCPLSGLPCIGSVLHLTCPTSDMSCPRSFLSCICPGLRPSCPASVLSTVQHLDCPTSVLYWLSCYRRREWSESIHRLYIYSLTNRNVVFTHTQSFLQELCCQNSKYFQNTF